MSAAYPQSFCMAEALPNASYRTVICAFDGSALTAEGGEVVAVQPATPATNADNAATPLAHSTSRREIAMALVLRSMSIPLFSHVVLGRPTPAVSGRRASNASPRAAALRS